MIVINAINVNHALRRGVEMFKRWERAGDEYVVAPRGMRTLEAPEPVCTVFIRPTERVLFSGARDANPFFHFFESLWMLAGRNDVEFVAMLNKQMAAYSDNGAQLWGAYGWRWRVYFGFDQIEEVVRLLRTDATSRRAVLQMWAPDGDLRQNSASGKDVPCNTAVYFKVRLGRLNMTVTNRSNDMLWGAYGANAVHMSMLQEYVADKLHVEAGLYRQVSDSFHVYLDDKGGALWDKLKTAPEDYEFSNRYVTQNLNPFPMGAMHPDWDTDLLRFMDKATARRPVEAEAFSSLFFQKVVVPLWRGWERRSVDEVRGCAADDWRTACLEWLVRRGH